MNDDQKAEFAARDALVKLLKDTEGYEDVSAIDGDGTATLGFYHEETGHEYFITVEPA